MPTPAECGVSWSLIVSGGLGICNIAAVIVLIRLVIAPVVVNVRAIGILVDRIGSLQQVHQDHITKIETIHELKGCDLPFGRRSTDIV